MADADATSTAFRVARPTLSVEGQDQATLVDGLLRLQIGETTEGLYRCEACFGNWGPQGNGTGFLYFDRQLLDFGKSFTVKLGSDTIFDGRITALEAEFPEGAPPELTVLAEDRFQDLRMTRRTASYDQVSDADVIQQIAQQHGLQADVDLTGPTHKVLTQVNQSDLAFMRERCRSADGELWMDGTTVHAQARPRRGSGGSFVLGFGNELLSFRVMADLATQRSAVTVSGWDVAGKQGISYEADESAVSSELDDTTSGASVLSQALGERKEALVHAVPFTNDEAQNRAEAYFRMIARQFLVGRGVAQTDVRLRVGARVDLQGLGPLFSGKYFVTEAHHIFDGSKGLRSEFVVERPGLGQP
jgi:phage protein D